MAFRPSGGEVPSLNPRVVPAQVHFLTIYNPTLGDTDETEKDQIVFWAGKDELGNNRVGRRASKSPDGTHGRNESTEGKRRLSEEQVLNDRLRQIGLARGMVDFARNFASDQPLDTIETDRSRIVLHELEKDWWILASIDLTRLPPVPVKSNDDSSKEGQPPVDYSAREVSPAFLLRAQLIKAHNLFLLHHAAGLWELYNRLGRTTFCAHLNKYWESFARKWDVLLHGNPAVDAFGDCVKLAGGGELGVGVGEEEWGSGEREVLEGFVERAEGLIECVVGRYGEVPPENLRKKLDPLKMKRLKLEDKMKLSAEAGVQPWLGAGEDPGPADGVVFSGVGTLSKRSLATVSQWMEAIFKYGDSAYGIGENPSARPRQRRKRPKIERQTSDDLSKNDKKSEQTGAEVHPRLKSPRNKAPDLRRKAMENNATPPGLPPGIPAPLVGAVERSLDEALAKVAERSSSKSPKSSPKQEKTEQEAMNNPPDDKEDSSSIFSMEGMKSIFSLGYGTNWTLNPNGFEKRDEKSNGHASKRLLQPELQGSKKPGDPPKSPQPPSGGKPGEEGLSNGSAHDRPRLERSKSGGGTTEQKEQEVPSTQNRPSIQRSISGSKPAQERLQEIDPTPEVSDEDMPFVQKLEQSIGRFLIGLSGDLENTEFEDSDDPASLSDNGRKSRAQRIFLRTLTVELAKTHYNRPGLQSEGRKDSQMSNLSKVSAASGGSVRSTDGPEPKTSAAASVDGAKPTKRYEKVQVAVYVHQPFIFVFMFELHSPKMTMPSFYRTIHHSLGPLQKPLLQRTDPTRVAERIAGALNENASAAVTAVRKHVDNNGNAIYDVVYDSFKNTIRTSLPNIPIPTSPSSATNTPSTVSGAWYTLGIPIGTSNSPSSSRLDPVGARRKPEPWTRVDALNVHTQVLNTLSATRNPNELERTVKTARGWWVLWMKISAPGKEVEDLKEAFLVRKSADYSMSRQSKDGARSSGSATGRWLLRDQSRDVSHDSNYGGNGGTGSSAKSVSEGVGIDAKKWVEGLLSLTQ